MFRKALMVLTAVSFIVCATASAGDRSTPEAAAVEFVTEVLDGNADKAFDMFDFETVANGKKIPEGNMATYRTMFGQVALDRAQKIKAAGGYKDVKAEPATYSNGNKRASVKVNYTVGGKPKHERVRLVLKGGEWAPLML